jgi:hypothetical protein
MGLDDMFRRNPIGTPGGKIPPSSIAVRFNKPMAIITDASGQNPYINFGNNKTADDIQFIGLGWGGRGIRTMRIKNGEPGFDEAAKWVLSNQEEFDLRPDGASVSGDIAPSDRTTGTGVEPAVNRGESLSESKTRVGLRPSLLDLYRF